VSKPDAGDAIAGTGGLRKVRWTTAGRGKRCGSRVIYYHVVAQTQIRMILIYRKDIKVAMDKKLFNRLVESMGQMDELVRGIRSPSREFYVDAAKVKDIRAITGLSQPRFAQLLQVDVGTLRNWEQGRREPTGPAKALLRAISTDPQAVLKALAA
jgi:putative transcriptional regulator